MLNAEPTKPTDRLLELSRENGELSMKIKMLEMQMVKNNIEY